MILLPGEGRGIDSDRSTARTCPSLLELEQRKRRDRASCDGGSAVIDAPRADRDRVCLGIAERAGLCALEPAWGGRLQVTFASVVSGREVASICRVARDRAWRAYRTVEAFSSASGECRRRTLLDHFGDRRPGAPVGRCCDVCDPDTIAPPTRRR